MVDPILPTANIIEPVKNTLYMGFSIITWVIIICIIASLSAVLILVLLLRRNYNHTIIKFEEDDNGNIIDVGREPAMALSFGSLGQRILYWKKSKIYTHYPIKKVGLRKAYFKRNLLTNEWEDFLIKNSEQDPEDIKIDSMRGKMISYNVGIRKGLKDYFEKHNWFKENIAFIVNVLSLIIIGVMMWLLMDKFVELAGKIDGLLDKANKLFEIGNQMLAKADVLTSGVKPA